MMKMVAPIADISAMLNLIIVPALLADALLIAAIVYYWRNVWPPAPYLRHRRALPRGVATATTRDRADGGMANRHPHAARVRRRVNAGIEPIDPCDFSDHPRRVRFAHASKSEMLPSGLHEKILFVQVDRHLGSPSAPTRERRFKRVRQRTIVMSNPIAKGEVRTARKV